LLHEPPPPRLARMFGRWAERLLRRASWVEGLTVSPGLWVRRLYQCDILM
jgi:hypothetical protein